LKPAKADSDCDSDSDPEKAARSLTVAALNAAAQNLLKLFWRDLRIKEVLNGE